MLIDTSNYQFWVVGSLWFTVPIMSWVWSMVCIRSFKKLNAVVKEAQDNLAKVQELHKEALKEKMDSKKYKAMAEHELKMANGFYVQIKQMLESQ